MHPYNHRIFFLLESIPPRAIKKWLKTHNNLIDYVSEHFAYFSSKRSQVMEELKQSLLENTIEFEFKDWVRIVSHQFSNTPLSAVGSIKNFPGGRFNIGNIDPMRFPQFAALYLAEDTVTAFLEISGIKQEEKIDGLTGKELAVAGNFSHFIINGKLSTILDLTNPSTLKKFYAHLQNIQLPIYFKTRASKLKISPMPPVKNLKELQDTLFNENWRLMPMQLDVPSNSQILGQIAYSAGIKAILYPSSKTGKNSLAIYPENFQNSDAFIEVFGKVADTVKFTRIDKLTYKNFIM